MRLKSIGFFLLALVLNQSRPIADSFTWKASRPLSWSDFMGRPQQNSAAVAQTVSGITFGYSIKTIDGRIVAYSTDIEAHFYPNKSWYIKDKADASILKHEQLHFDITELYARHFRKGLKNIRVNQNLKRQLDDLQKSINEALNETQKRYDQETNHSINKIAQKQWQDNIEVQLNELKSFALK